jgi:CDP-diacylglycerol--glycerol-3-phosphate 3-phosphatidyltransferase
LPEASTLFMSDPVPSPTAAPRFWNVPNTLSVARMVLSVVVFALIGMERYFLAAAVFGVAAITDALDGYLARRLNQVTPIGRQLDPLVDKVIVAGAYIYLLTVPGTGVMPWMVTTIVIRELLIQGLRSHLEGQGQAFGAKTAGKIKTTLQCLSITAILLCLAAKPDWAWLVARDVLTWLAVFMTLYSGLGYLVSAFPAMKGEGVAR